MEQSGICWVRGTTEPGLDVEIRDSTGAILAKCKSDALGNFGAYDIRLPIGDHRFDVVAIRGGHQVGATPVEVTVAADEDDWQVGFSDAADASMLASMGQEQADFTAEDYSELVEAVAIGVDVDALQAEQILAACGRTGDDLLRDVTTALKIQSLERLEQLLYGL